MRSTTRRRRTLQRLLGAALCLGALSLSVGHVPEAHAIVGLPFTPLSYAGVARRTARRSAYMGGYYGGYWGGAAPAYAPGTVAALPAGCATTVVGGVVQNNCAGTIYQPYYQGPNVVYVPAY
jgi:hypothetical protein